MSKVTYQVDFSPALIIEVDCEMSEDEVIDMATEELMSWSKEQIISWLHEYSTTVEEYDNDNEDEDE